MVIQRRQVFAYLFLLIAILIVLVFLKNDQPKYIEEEDEIKIDEPKQSLDPRRYLLLPPKCLASSFAMIVHIRVEAFDRRNEWRYSYGTFQKIFNFTLFFAIGSPTNHSIFPRLKQESNLFGDLIMADYVDNYKNLTLKHLSQLRFFNEHCKDTKFLVKLDDDVAVNVVQLSNFISSIYEGSAPWFGLDTSMGPKIWCRVWKDSVVRRSTSQKWAVPRSRWQKQIWPNYCAGMGYIATHSAVSRLLLAAEEETWLWVDDVFISGILAEKGKVHLVPIDSSYSLDENNELPFIWGNTIFALTWRNETWNFFDQVN